MMTCEMFRARFGPDTEDAALLEHVRSCDSCLAAAAEIDPDIMFRALGGPEMVPPGGVDAFVGDVMREVRLRSTEQTMDGLPETSWRRRGAIAAALALAVTSGIFFSRDRAVVAPADTPIVRSVTEAPPVAFVSRPVVEQYDSDRATIVEMPSEGVGNVAVVMVFDENLPADL